MTGEVSAATSGFMAAEEAAEHLVNSLKRLNEEAEKYSSAGKRLDQVGTEVRELASRTADVATRTAEAVEALRSVGAAQVLNQVSKLSQSFDKQVQAVGGVSSKVDAQGEEVHKIVATLDKLAVKISDLSVLQRTIATETKLVIEDAASKTRPEAEAAAKAARMALYAAVAAAILAALAAILTRV